MLNTKKTDLKKNTFKFELTIPKEQIKKAYDEAFNKLTLGLEVEGFRKGKAPAAIAEKHIKKEAVYNSLINTILPDIYRELITQENLKPVASPKVELVKANDNEDWVVNMTVAEKPIVKLKDYKKVLQKLKADQKKDDIWVPGKEQKPEEDPKAKEAKEREYLNKVFEAILKETDIEISDIILDEEINKRLTKLVDDVQKLGLTMDAYLQSKGETMESIRAKLITEITDTYKLEFALEEIADSEKIVVEDKDIEKLFGDIKDEKAKEEAKKNAYFYATILKRQKTLDYLASL
jgi:trigger factor